MEVRKIHILKFVLSSFIIVFLFSCNVYKQNIMFKVDGNKNYDSLGVFVEELQANYKIDIDDYLEVDVYTSNGEQLIDPENKLEVSANINGNRGNVVKYLIDVEGNVKLPMVGIVKLEGYTFSQADSVLAIRYNEFYEGTFVKTKALNRRVTVLGANGGEVITLENENINLLEVLALAGGVNNSAKATNIRLIRGDLNNPAVQIIDLTTIEGMRRASLKVQNRDVIYIEPVRKPVLESIRDISPIISLLTSLITFAFLISAR